MGTLGELASRVGNYARLQILGVLAPGALVLVELWLLARAPDERHLHLGSKSGVVVAGAVLLGLYAAYVAGYLVRTFSWWVTRPRRWLRKEELRPEELKKAIGDAYGPRSLERILDRHPALAAAADVGAVHSYCKCWLQTHEPRLSMDYLEGEINVLLGTIVPLVLLIGVAFRQLGKAWESWVALGVLGVVLFVVWKSVQLARDEVSDSLRNLCLSIWFDDAA